MPVWKSLDGFAQRKWRDEEAGGVLLGRRITNRHGDYVVDAITTPLSGDRRSRTRFDRRDTGHQVRIDEYWSATDGTGSYLGEWHTHPEPDPTPSAVDLADWARRLREDVVPDLAETFFVIVGTEQVRVWRGDRANGAISPMTGPGDDHTWKVMMAKRKTQPTKSAQEAAPSHPDCEDVTRHVKEPTRYALIAAAGGKCQFHGCPRFLFEHHVTKEPGNFAECAHIIAFKRGGSRGDHPERSRDLHAFENLMLLCPTCHKLIDSESEKHPVETLRVWKRTHEERVRWLLGLDETSECAVLEIWTDVANPPVVRSDAKVVEALHPLYASERYWEVIDLAGNSLSDSVTVAAAREAIDARVAHLFKARGARPSCLAVLGIAPMPVLMHLGARLGDRFDVRLFQHHRDSKKWVWHQGEGRAQFHTSQLRQGSDPERVALILSLSDPVVPVGGLSESTVELDDSFTVYEMRLVSDVPNRDFLRTPSDLERFRQAYGEFYATLGTLHKRLRQLHVYPAVPVPVAIAMGMQRLPKIHPTMCVHDEDRQRGGWRHVLDIE